MTGSMTHLALRSIAAPVLPESVVAQPANPTNASSMMMKIRTVVLLLGEESKTIEHVHIAQSCFARLDVHACAPLPGRNVGSEPVGAEHASRCTREKSVAIARDGVM